MKNYLVHSLSIWKNLAAIVKKWSYGQPLIKYDWKIYSLVYLSTLSHPASFFQQGIIGKTDDLLTIHAEKIELSSVVNAWCEACNKNCTIAHDSKHKINIHADHVSCDHLLKQILDVSDLIYQQSSQEMTFTHPTKGYWVSHQFQYRAVDEIKQLLLPLLGQSSKSYLLSDAKTNTLWVPKAFYQTHKNQIFALDQVPQTYLLVLQFIRLNEDKTKDTLFIPSQQLLQWLNQPMPIQWLKASQQLQALEQEGVLTQSRSYQLPCQINQLSQSTIDETIPIPFYNKKGIKQLQTVTIGLHNEIKLISVVQNRLTFEIKIIDSSHSDTQQTNTQIQTTISIPIGHSTSVGKLHKSQQLILKKCPSILGAIPIVGALFCQKQRQQKDEEFYMIATVKSNQEKLGRLDSNQGS
ncbi:hypothetical protein OAT84_00635 [Gammaproteobacteria bacterium]|nr:hypothetical protein [Gammaproteobacteria bacterium]